MRSVLAAALAVSFATAAPAEVGVSLVEIAETPLLTLRVRETIRSEPDRATIHAGVETRAATAVEALANNSATMSRVLSAIHAAGVSEGEIQTARISVRAQYARDVVDGRQQRRFEGYRASNSVQIRLEDIAELGKLLDTLVTAGATNITGPHFSASVSDSARREARAKALAAADAEAAEFARLRGYAKARLVSLNEAGTSAEIVVMGSRSGSSAPVPPPPPPPPPVAAGQVSTSVTLSLQYILVR